MANKSSNYVILAVRQNDTGETYWIAAAAGLADLKTARAWLKAKGVDGQSYDIAAFKGGRIKVHTEKLERRTLEEA